VGFVKAYKNSSGETIYEKAESFLENLNAQGKKRTQVIFHMDLMTDRCELAGVGPLARQAAIDALESASRALVGTIDNKLVQFSEQDRRSTTAPLTEMVKRAILARDWHSCQVPGCTNPGEHVDHITARTNQGSNEFENLQSICEPDHHAKTKKDAPWTAGGIYAKYADTG